MTCFNYLLYHALLGNAYSIYLFNGNNQESWLCRRDTFLPKNLVKVLVYITRNKNCHFVGEARGVATRLSPAKLRARKALRSDWFIFSLPIFFTCKVGTVPDRERLG